MESDKMSTAATLNSILQLLRFVEENQVKSMAVLRTLRLEVEDACGRLQQLEYSHKTAVSEINGALQQYGEQMSSMSRRREQEKIRTSLWHLHEELEREKETCRLLRLQNKKLSKELEQVSLAAATACQELEKERKTRELMEDVCDELVKEIGRDKAEIERLRKERKVKESMDEREATRIARLVRFDRKRRQGLVYVEDEDEDVDEEEDDANGGSSEHNSDQHSHGPDGVILKDLKRQLQAFVSTVGSAGQSSPADIKQQVEQATMLRQALDKIPSQEANGKEEEFEAKSRISEQKKVLFKSILGNSTNDVEENNIAACFTPVAADNLHSKRICRMRGCPMRFRRTKSCPINYTDALEPVPFYGGCDVDQPILSSSHDLGKIQSRSDRFYDMSKVMEQEGPLQNLKTNCSKETSRVASHDKEASESKFSSSSDQEVAQRSCFRSCRNNVLRLGHRKGHLLDEFAGPKEREVMNGIAATEAQKVIEDVKGIYKGPGCNPFEGNISSNCGQNDVNNGFIDPDIDECKGSVFEFDHNCPAEGSAVDTSVQEGHTSKELEKSMQGDPTSNAVDVESTGDISCGCSGSFRRLMEPSYNSASQMNPDQELQSANCNNMNSVRNEATVEADPTMISPLLRPSIQSDSSTPRPVKCFWCPSPNHFSGAAAKALGAGDKHLALANRGQHQKFTVNVSLMGNMDGRCKMANDIKAWSNTFVSESNEDDHGKSNDDYHDDHDKDINDNDMESQQDDQIRKSHSLRVQLLKARQLENTDIIKMGYPTSKFRFSPLRSRLVR